MGRSYSEKVRRRSQKRNGGAAEKTRSEERRPFPFIPLIIVGVILTLIGASIYLYLGSEAGGEGGPSDDGSDVPNDDGQTDDAGEIELENVDGGVLTLGSMKGRVVLIDMFATWCGPCEMQMDELNELRTRFAQSKLQILSVDVDLSETAQQVRDFRDREGAIWEFARSNAQFNKEFPAGSIPTLYILDKEGNVAFTHVGVTDVDVLAAEIRSLV